MMSPVRFEQLWSGTTVVARKVYDSVPVENEWMAQEIYSDITRRGINIAYTSLCGCLDSLRSAGLIKESRRGYKRVPVRAAPPRVVAPAGDLATVMARITSRPAEPVEPANPVMPVEQPKPKETPMPATAALPPTPNVVDAISTLSQKLAAMAQRHMQEMQDLAHAISDVAIDVQGEFERNEADLVKVRQLQTVLKGIFEHETTAAK